MLPDARTYIILISTVAQKDKKKYDDNGNKGSENNDNNNNNINDIKLHK